ncbi:efflux RND transporter periplasmic adaptor subunit [Edaphobacter sp.]|uniref:efflux RND transporter periplasmic adaptor subunit n=1 Tax=Edaphobacter sp. TaxID=1934404 RepID=UPI002DB9A75F|nr:efflux RND transporter periplasmic adaptor subunit [Edaphobacter sp.]HEU5339735.1 efflux RND transporter periplasmic adaptor subunit [Edaphobacter sp.]
MMRVTSPTKFDAVRWRLAALIVPVCAAALICGCNGKEAAPTVEVSVEAAHPEVGAISEHIQADATLAPLAQAALSPKISAPVKRFYVQRGAKVKAGELLAVLENRDLEAAALDNKGAYTAAQAAYQTATKAQVPEDLQKAQLDLAQTKATLDLNQSIVNSRKQLFSEGAIPGRDLDTAMATLVQAQAAYETAKKHLEGVESVGHKAALESAKGQLTSAEGKYLGAEAQVSYSEIRSPINGVVTDRSLFAGETAPAGTPLLTVMDTSALLAKVHIALAEAQRLRVGSPATLQVPGVDEPVPAKVSLISPALDPGSTTVEVWLRVENPKGTYKVGTPVHVVMEGRSAQNALLIPSGALLTAQDGSKSVMVVGVDSVAHSRRVTVGLVDDGKAQIDAGITAKDLVIYSGNYGLDEGTKVKVVSPGDAEKPGAGQSGDDK